MSRIDELIAELCPNGVPYRALGDVAAYSDTRVPASIVDGETFVGVDNLRPNQAGRTVSEYVPIAGNLTEYRVGDVLIGNIRPYLKKIWLATNIGGCSGDVLAIRINDSYHGLLVPEFLFRLLSSEAFFAYDTQHAKGGKMPRGSKSMILKYRIPVPPLEVQREIVRILDTFTTLEAELEARRRQYAHYRDALLTFPEGGSGGRHWVRSAFASLRVERRQPGIRSTTVATSHGCALPKWITGQSTGLTSLSPRTAFATHRLSGFLLIALS